MPKKSNSLGRKLPTVLSIFFAGLTCAYAIPVPIFNTGVNDAGVKLPTGAADAHWQVVAGPGISTPSPAYVVGGSPLYAFGSKSQWIWVVASGRAATKNPYTFSIDFDLTGLDPETAVLSGAWGVDNLGQLLINGKTPVGTGTFSLTTVGVQTFNPFHPFTITDGFVAGINTLQIQAIDDTNPGAFSVSALVASADIAAPAPTPAPEPPTIALFVCALLALALRRHAA